MEIVTKMLYIQITNYLPESLCDIYNYVPGKCIVLQYDAWM